MAASSLVSYTDSDESETASKNILDEEEDNQKVKLPVPEQIKNLFTETKGKKKSDAKHHGRIRNFPHVPGNWATHIYIPIEFERDQLILINRLISHLKSEQLDFDAHLCDDFHISLSRTFPIKRHSIEPLWKSVNQEFEEQTRFSCVASRLSTFTNDEKTRTFIAFEFDRSECGVFYNMIKSVDKCLKEFKFPTYYKNPTIHLSFAWCLHDVKSSLDERALSKLNELYLNTTAFTISIERLQYRSGNRVFTRKLKLTL